MKLDYARPLEGRLAVVTDAGLGVGRRTAELFLSQGARVALIGVPGEGFAGESIPGDLASAEDVRRMCAEAVARLGGADILVNAAYEPDEAGLSRYLSLSVNAAIRCVKCLMPAMKERRRGDIVNVAPDTAAFARAGDLAASAAGGALVAFTRSVTMDYIRYHVRANCVLYPLSAFEGRAPVTGAPDADDAANAALWFSCDLSRFIIGEALPVNGGIEKFANGEAARHAL